ncbi:MAG TPA: lysylphosphatidylglycerol synthase transmembrane domain-containing protein, partial [Gemmatimonadaceae bacterium]|nr:lysylphosphatidylglycerol synthase transmembrane domain-containing protein [Gemmatimonadaceae bacterium]
MTGKNAGTRPWLHWAISAATIVLLVAVARRVEWNQTWSAIRETSPGLMGVAVIANLLTLAFKSVRWWLFLAAAGVDSLSLVARATFAGAALNNVVIANGGDAARVAAISRRAGVSSATVLATLAVDRACDLITYVLLFAGSALALPLPGELARWHLPAIIAFVVLAAVGGLLVTRGASRIPVGETHVGADDTTLLGRVSAYARRMVATMTSVATT